MTMEEGYYIPKMKALIDFYYVDQFDNLLEFDRLEKLIKENQINESRLKMEVLREAYDQMMQDQKPVRNLLIAEGIAPEIGAPGKIEFTYDKSQEDPSFRQIGGMAKVSVDDPLCHIESQGVGAESGVNVLGETLPPLPGVSIELEKLRGFGFRMMERTFSLQLMESFSFTIHHEV